MEPLEDLFINEISNVKTDEFSDEDEINFGAYSDHLDLGIDRLRLTAQQVHIEHTVMYSELDYH